MNSSKQPPVSRSKFFRSIFNSLANLVNELCGDHLEQAANRLEDSFPALLRPPGAISEEIFLKTCRRCGECVRACPHFVLRLYFRPNSFFEKIPFFDPTEGYCRMCEGFPCIKACSSGALVMPGEGLIPTLGIIEISPERCMNSRKVERKQICNACVGACPARFSALIKPALPDLPPMVNSDACKGCGACISICPVKHEPAIILKQK